MNISSILDIQNCCEAKMSFHQLDEICFEKIIENVWCLHDLIELGKVRYINQSVYKKKVASFSLAELKEYPELIRILDQDNFENIVRAVGQWAKEGVV